MRGVILTSYFSAKQHPQLGDPHIEGVGKDGRVSQNDIDYIGRWHTSVCDLGLNGVVFYDNLTPDFVETFSNKNVEFVRVEPSDYSNNDWRFFCFRNWLYERQDKYDWVFHSDGSDVTVVNDPTHLIEGRRGDYDYFACKDSIKLSEFPYLGIHQQFGWDGFMDFGLNQIFWDLINMGVVGGTTERMWEFYKTFCDVRLRMGEPQFNADMWLCQYLLRKKLPHRRVLIGDPVTSEFKQYQTERKDVYFIHK